MISWIVVGARWPATPRRLARETFLAVKTTGASSQTHKLTFSILILAGAALPVLACATVDDEAGGLAGAALSKERPQNCEPSCGGRTCGDDGCGGSCGYCSFGQECDGWGQCQSTCRPDCSFR